MGCIGLTRQQARLLRHIGEFISAYGYGPSFEGMRAAMGLKSNSGILRLLTALEERGRIRRIPKRARAIEVLVPWDARPAPQRAPVHVTGQEQKIAHIPLRGKINLNEHPSERMA